MRISNATSRVHLSRTRRLMTRPPGLSSALAPLPGGVTDGPVCPLCCPLSFVGTSRVGVCGSSSVKRRLLFLSVAPSGNWSVLDFFCFSLCRFRLCLYKEGKPQYADEWNSLDQEWRMEATDENHMRHFHLPRHKVVFFFIEGATEILSSSLLSFNDSE